MLGSLKPAIEIRDPCGCIALRLVKLGAQSGNLRRRIVLGGIELFGLVCDLPGRTMLSLTQLRSQARNLCRRSLFQRRQLA